MRTCVGLVLGGGGGAVLRADRRAAQLKGTVAQTRPEWEQKAAYREKKVCYSDGAENNV